MSGVEVAGIVLAVMPLFISALEDYNDGLDPIKSFMRWERELPQFIRKLRNQHVHFEQTLRLLLAPITTEMELAEMIAEPNGHLWTDATMAERLKEKLQESHKAYQSTISDIERIMTKIASKLDLERSNTITRNDLEAMLIANPQKANQKFEFRKRVKFGMSKKTIKGLLEELNDCNKELERFTERSSKLETYRKASKPSFAMRLRRIQQYAKSLHYSLEQSFTCSCCTSHSTNLQLEQRVDLYATKTFKSNTNGTYFTVSFSSTSAPWTWQEAQIRIHEKHEDGLNNRPRILKGVSFSTPVVPPPYSIIDTKASLHQAVEDIQEVQDMCLAIQQAQKSHSCIGLSLDEKNKLRGVYPAKSRLSPSSSEHDQVTLEELLTQATAPEGRPMKLSKKERYSLAVTLASSTMQLFSTPWFPDQWSNNDIAFHRTTDGPRPIDTEHPYVTSRLMAFAQEPVNSTIRTFQNKNTVLLALAIALLELYFGVSAKQHQEVDLTTKDGSANPWHLCAMAYEWTEKEKENLSAAFLAAVTHCLRCFGDPGSSLQDPAFLQAAVESIVLPLQDELSQFLGRTAP